MKNFYKGNYPGEVLFCNASDDASPVSHLPAAGTQTCLASPGSWSLLRGHLSDGTSRTPSPSSAHSAASLRRPTAGHNESCWSVGWHVSHSTLIPGPELCSPESYVQARTSSAGHVTLFGRVRLSKTVARPSAVFEATPFPTSSGDTWPVSGREVGSPGGGEPFSC